MLVTAIRLLNLLSRTGVNTLQSLYSEPIHRAMDVFDIPTQWPLLFKTLGLLQQTLYMSTAFDKGSASFLETSASVIFEVRDTSVPFL